MEDSNTTKTLLPYNLQFFAEPNPVPAPEPTPTPEPTPAPTPEPTPTPEPQLTAEEQLVKALAEQKRLKAAMDKAASEAADFKKKYRATLDEKERLDLEKAEREAQRDAELQSLKRENTVNKMAKSFITMGYTEDQAIKAATAQLDGDYDEFFRIQNAFQAGRDKAREAEWMKKAPVPPAGDPGKITDAFVAGFDKG